MTKSSKAPEPTGDVKSPLVMIRAAGEVAMLRRALSLCFAAKDLDDAIKELIKIRKEYADYPFPRRTDSKNHRKEVN